MSYDAREQFYAPFLTTTSIITRTTFTLSLLFLVYGIYIITFGLAIRVLTRRQSAPVSNTSKLYLWWTVSFFALNTLYVPFCAMMYIRTALVKFEALQTKNWDLIDDYYQHDTTTTVCYAMMNFTMALMNIIADWMLIHRCYVIWGMQKSVLYPLALLSIIINGILLGSLIPDTVGFSVRAGENILFQMADTVNVDTSIAVAFFNLLLTLLTAGRIWWISSPAQKLFGRSTHTQYKTIVTIIIESGILYPAVLLAAMVFNLVLGSQNKGRGPVDLTAVSTQLSGLAPTLIIVRVAYSKSTDCVHQAVSTLEFTEPESNVDPDQLQLRPTAKVAV